MERQVIHMEVDVIIPIYKPGDEFFSLLNRLYAQTVKIHQIILVHTVDGEAFDSDLQLSFLKQSDKKIRIYEVKKEEFDHGMTRRLAVEKSDAEIFVMMTQDALPADRRLIEKLIAPLTGDVAVAYARQLPRKNCRAIERFTRKFNYPDSACIKGIEDLPQMGIKTFFCSDVCAAYRREIYEKLDGFPVKAIFNEDMIFAAHAVKAGFKVAYAADAKVLHSHNYTCRQQFMRNFDLGVSQAENPDVFKGVPSEKEGGKMVKETVGYLFTSGRAFLIPYFFIQCVCKYAGYLLGKHFRLLPGNFIQKCTMSPNYWQ